MKTETNLLRPTNSILYKQVLFIVLLNNIKPIEMLFYKKFSASKLNNFTHFTQFSTRSPDFRLSEKKRWKWRYTVRRWTVDPSCKIRGCKFRNLTWIPITSIRYVDKTLLSWRNTGYLVIYKVNYWLNWGEWMTILVNQNVIFYWNFHINCYMSVLLSVNFPSWRKTWTLWRDKLWHVLSSWNCVSMN